MQGVKILKSTDDEIEILNKLDKSYKKYSQMSEQDRSFINSLVIQKQPKKLLELGVCSGGSSIVILNAIKDIEDAHLYSLDYNKKHYTLKNKMTGFYVDNYPELKTKWTLKTGGLALNFMDEIKSGIDFCLIDTVHSNPGEILDFLMILPYLKDDAILVFHDTNLHTRFDRLDISDRQYTNNLLMSAIEGEKIIPSSEVYKSDFPFYNIGAIQLNKNTKKQIWEIFNLLTIRWSYIPSCNDIEKITNFINKHYGIEYCDYFKKVVNFQKKKKSFFNSKKQSFLKNIFSIEKVYSADGSEMSEIIKIFFIKIKKRRK